MVRPFQGWVRAHLLGGRGQETKNENIPAFAKGRKKKKKKEKKKRKNKQTNKQKQKKKTKIQCITNWGV
jgi:hypothetical protein